MVNLESDIDNKVINLSGGMARRVSIALSTIGNPKIIIFDEPTTGLDPETRQLIWVFMKSLKDKERSIFLTTHILEEADVLSDNLCIMSLGQIKAKGTSSYLKKRYG
jgi:ABC-2 type transport system ATP-binding protein